MSAQGWILAVLYALTALAGTAWLALQVVPPRGERHWYWLRWTSMIALIAGWGLVAVYGARGLPFRVPSMTLLLTSVGIACLQWFHVWFVAWPGVRTGGEPARAAAALAVNRATLVPLAFFFAASPWARDLAGDDRWVAIRYWIPTAAAYAALGAAALLAPRLVARALARLPVALAVGVALLFPLRYF